MADDSKKDDDKQDWKEQFAKKGGKAKKSVSKADGDDDGDGKKKTDDDPDVDSKWVKKGKAKKSDSDDEDDRDDEASKADDGDDDDDDEDMEKKASKSKVKKSLSSDTMEKSLRALSGFIQDNDRSSRKATLLSKAQNNELRKSEREELMGLLGGEAPGEAPLGEQLTKSLDHNEAVQGTIDVSDYISNLHDTLNKSLSMVGGAIEAMDDRQAEFNLLTARTLHQSGSLIKSLAERIGVLEAQPARAPKSRGAQPLQKSFMGGPPNDGNTLSKSQVLDTLTDMNAASWADNRNGLSKGGEDLALAVAKYEQTSQLSPGLAAEVRTLAASRQGSR